MDITRYLLAAKEARSIAGQGKLVVKPMAAASAALAGRLSDAQKIMKNLREIDPTLRLSNLEEVIPLRRPEDFNRLADGLREAGLP